MPICLFLALTLDLDLASTRSAVSWDCYPSSDSHHQQGRLFSSRFTFFISLFSFTSFHLREKVITQSRGYDENEKQALKILISETPFYAARYIWSYMFPIYCSVLECFLRRHPRPWTPRHSKATVMISSSLWSRFERNWSEFLSLLVYNMFHSCRSTTTCRRPVSLTPSKVKPLRCQLTVAGRKYYSSLLSYYTYYINLYNTWNSRSSLVRPRLLNVCVSFTVHVIQGLKSTKGMWTVVFLKKITFVFVNPIFRSFKPPWTRIIKNQHTPGSIQAPLSHRRKHNPSTILKYKRVSVKMELCLNNPSSFQFSSKIYDIISMLHS